MAAPTPTSSPVTEHLLRQLQDEEMTAAAGEALAQQTLLQQTLPQQPSTDMPRPPAGRSDVDTSGSVQSPANLTELTGLETMARPWRLFLLALGAAIGLFAWLVVVNGQSTLGSPLVSVAAFVAALSVGIGLLAIANERDRLGPKVNVLGVAVGLAYAVVVWLNPTPLADVDRWALSQRLLLTFVGFAAGLVLAGVICLALLRRSPTLAVALSIVAGVLVLAAVTAFRESEWGGAALFFFAFFLVLGAWDRSPRREVAFEHPPDSPRAARAALSLSILALSGTAIDYTRHSVNRDGWWLIGVVLAVALIVFAVSVLFRLRSELENRDTRLSDWTSWMREIRTNEFRRGFENMAAPKPDQPDAPFADLGEPLRAESDVAVSSTADSIPSSYPRLQAPTTTVARPHEGTEATVAATAARPHEGTEATVAEISASPPFDFATAVRAEDPVDTSQGAAQAQVTSPGVPAITIPTADQGDTAAAGTPPAELYRAPRPTGNGVFSVFAQPEPIAHQVPDADAFANWLAAAPTESPALFIAIECMYLSTFSALSPAYQSRVVARVAESLLGLSPRPHPIAWIDGPYFLAAISSFERHHISALNRQLRELLTAELVFDEVSIQLQGTLALLTPRASIGFAELLDEAVNGLIQAREFEA